MTIKEFMLKYLTERGMFENQAKAVIDNSEIIQNNFAERMNDNIADYPTATLVGLEMNLDIAALNWIDENVQQAFFRSMLKHSFVLCLKLSPISHLNG